MKKTMFALGLLLAASAAVAQTFPINFGVPELKPVAMPAGAANVPVCSGPNLKANAPLFMEGISPTVGKVTVAYCLTIDGYWNAWVRIRPAGDVNVNAPVQWLVDVAPRGTPVVAPPPIKNYIVSNVGVTGASRPSYAVMKDPIKGYVLGKADGGRAQVGVACTCDAIYVQSGSTLNRYCPYAPAALIGSVALCKPIETPAELTKAKDTLRMLDILRNPEPTNPRKQ